MLNIKRANKQIILRSAQLQAIINVYVLGIIKHIMSVNYISLFQDMVCDWRQHMLKLSTLRICLLLFVLLSFHTTFQNIALQQVIIMKEVFDIKKLFAMITIPIFHEDAQTHMSAMK